MANELPDYSYYEAVLRYHELTWELLQQKYPELRGNGQNYIKDEKGRFAGSRPGGGSGSAAAKQHKVNADVTVETDFTANRKIIGSYAYDDKFDDVTRSGFINEKVADTARECIYKNDGTMDETVVFISAFTGRKIGNPQDLPYNPGSSKAGGSVIVPDAFNNGLILVHNHGNSSPFSFEDFYLLNECPQIKTMIAAGHNGTVFKMSVGSGKRLDMSGDKKYNYERDFNNLYNFKTGDLKAIKKYCNDLGWRFEYE